jgi:hypothetical protein
MIGRSFAVFAWLCIASAAQAPSAPKNDQELDRQVVQVLVGFARSAESWKAFARAREAWQQILDQYDSDHSAARIGLGWKKVGGVWEQTTPTERLPASKATAAQMKQVAEAWRVASKRIAGLHAAFAKQLDGSGDRARAVHHFERALVFEPAHAESHQALGHDEWEGFYGKPEQIEFAKRFRAILAQAREIAASPVDVTALPVEDMPPELRATGLAFAGARSRWMTFWVSGGDSAAAAEFAAWYDRAVRLLQFLVGVDARRQRHLRWTTWRWTAVLRGPEVRNRLLEVAPVALGDDTLARVLLRGGKCFRAVAGEAEWALVYRNDADYAVGQATKRCTPWFNDGLSEGLVHTMTWLLCGTTHAGYFQLAVTQASGSERSERDPDAWLRALRAELSAEKDWPLVQVPRETMSNFRDPVRFKSWLFVSWLLARHPDSWVELLVQLEGKKTVEEVAAIFNSVLRRSVDEVEAEWRDWVRTGSPLGKVSGLPQ